MPKDRTSTRYSSVAIWLHWAIAILLITMMAVGIWMTDAIKAKETQAIAFEVYQFHKSFGILIFVLSVARVLWRLSHAVPELPHGMAVWERLAAHGTHLLFYALMLALPLTGWLMVSASPWGLPTIIFSTVEVPHLSSLSELDQTGKMLWEGRFKGIHKYMAFGGAGLIFLHIGAALKHHFITRDDSLTRMAPILKNYKLKD